MSKYELVPMPGLKLNREDYTTNLQFIRNDARITQKQLAERSGVSQRMIEFYESKFRDINKAQAITVYKLANVLKCSVEDLLEK